MNVGRKLLVKMEEEVLDKYMVENRKREAYRGRRQGSSLGSESKLCSVSKVCRKDRPRRKR